MTTLAAGSSTQVSIPVGYTLTVAQGGQGVAVFGPGRLANQQYPVGRQTHAFGPYADAQTVYLTATTAALNYTVSNASASAITQVLAASVGTTPYQGAGVLLQDENGTVYSWNGTAYAPASLKGGAAYPWTAVKFGQVGDSITQGIAATPLSGNFNGLMEPLVASNSGLNGALFSANVIAFHGAQRNCPAGNGTLKYTKATNSITWQANGDTGPGAAVTLDRTRFVRLESATSGYGIYVTLRPDGAGTLPSADTTDTSVNVGATGNGYRPNCQFISECFADWMKPLLGPGYKMMGKWATSGNRIQNIIDQLPDIIAAGLDEVLLMIGTNDIAAAGSTYAGVTAGLQTILDALTAVGIRVTLPGIIPRGDAALTLSIRAVNAWMQQYAASNRLLRYIDTWQVLLNSSIAYPGSSPYGVDTTMYNTTGGNYIHPSRKGSYALAKAIASAMRDSRMPGRYEDPADLYDATKNPYGNLITNPQMLVSSSRSGSVAGSNFNANTTGTVPDDWTLYSPGAGTAASTTAVSRSSIDSSDTTDGNYWKINLTGAGVIEAFIPITLSNLSPGDIIEWWADFYVDNPSLLTRFDAGLDINGADRLWFGINTADSLSTETSARRFTLASPRMQVPSSWAWTGQASQNPSNDRFYVYMNASSSANVYIANVGLRKVRS
jgi:lysophospholipase L1-like esterase